MRRFYLALLWWLSEWAIRELERVAWVSPASDARWRGHFEGEKNGAEEMHHLITCHDMTPTEARDHVITMADRHLVGDLHSIGQPPKG